MHGFTKETLQHSEFYIVKFIKDIDLPYVLFIHGGPGLNCATLEYLLEHYHFFKKLNYNIIMYDQRNCGRSRESKKIIQHWDNISDLDKIISELSTEFKLEIQVLIGHSYGAKVLYDYYNHFKSSIPAVFLATAESLLTPRLNNLMLDLMYLKKNNPEQYNHYFDEMDFSDLDKIWELTEKLTPLFQENKDRPYVYWSDLQSYKLVKQVQKEINLPLNTNTFISVRKDLYTNKKNLSVDISTLKIPTLWINGFHDLIMNGQGSALTDKKEITTFYKSSHYPHIEENERFCEVLNEFVKSN